MTKTINRVNRERNALANDEPLRRIPQRHERKPQRPAAAFYPSDSDTYDAHVAAFEASTPPLIGETQHDQFYNWLRSTLSPDTVSTLHSEPMMLYLTRSAFYAVAKVRRRKTWRNTQATQDHTSAAVA